MRALVRGQVIPAIRRESAIFGAMFIRGLILVLALGFLLPSLLAAREAREQSRIEFLIQHVEDSQGLKFIRNGSPHDGKAAAKHLRSKLAYAGGRVKTAEEFVQHCAAKSSMTKQLYQISAADGSITDAATYLLGKLREFDKEKR